MGIEPTLHSQENLTNPDLGSAQSGAVGAGFPPIDPDLAKVVQAWPTLPELVRRAVLALIETV
jgi:hypothetical protein